MGNTDNLNDLDTLILKLKMLVTIYDGIAQYSKCNICRARKTWCENCRNKHVSSLSKSFEAFFFLVCFKAVSY